MSGGDGVFPLFSFCTSRHISLSLTSFTSPLSLSLLLLLLPAIWRYWLGKEWRWNNFDFVIVLACVPGLFDLGSQVVVLRLLRLMRLAKVFRKIPQLQMIVMGLVGGLKSISYIVLLLCLVFYLYAIVGVMMFRDNDPFHWYSLPVAMMTLFRIATLEDWTDVMYFNIFGCDEYSSGGGLTYCDLATEDCSRLTDFEEGLDGSMYFVKDCSVEYCCTVDVDCKVGDVNDLGEHVRHVLVDGDLSDLSGLIIYGSTALCARPRASSLLAPLYFISFVVVSALVMLSLFVGAVTMAMAESMTTMKEEADENDRLRRLEKGKQEAATIKRTSSFSPPLQPRSPPFSEHLSSEISTQASVEEEMVTGKQAREKAKLKNLLLAAWDGTEAENLDDSLNFVGWRRNYVKVADVLETITTNFWFVNFVILVILLAGVQVGLQTYEEFAAANAGSLTFADNVITSIFTLEVGMKILACEFEPWVYFSNGWNRFDFAIVVGGYLPLDFDLNMLRLLRLLRVLKLVNKLPSLQVIVVALMMGVSSIGYIGVILFIFFYFFSIIGMIFFAQNDPWHFGTLHMTMLTLFRCSTLEDWTDVMYINTYGCEIFGYSDTMNAALEGNGCGSAKALSKGSYPPSIIYEGSSISAVYFLIFIMIGALVLLTLFVGVVTTSMEEATNDMKAAQAIEAEVTRVSTEKGLDLKQVDTYRTVFKILDLDGSGSIEEEELKIGLGAIDRCPSDQELSAMLLEVDENNDGEVDFAEFLMFMMVVKRRQSDKEAAEKKVAAKIEEEAEGVGDLTLHHAAIDEALAKSAGWKSHK